MEAMLEGLSNKPKMPRGMKDMRKHGVQQTVIDHAHDGTYKITHNHMKPGVAPTTHGAPDLEALKEHLQQILGGKPNKEQL